MNPGFPDPDFYPSRIPDPTTALKEEGKNFFCCSTIFCSHKDHKIVNNFIFERVKKTISTKSLRIIVLFTQKFFIKLSKNMGLGSGIQIRKKPISGSWIQGQKGTGSRIRIRNTDGNQDKQKEATIFKI